jgi:1-acyl-sn-glycerol-3-phosphate acyltransferase
MADAEVIPLGTRGRPGRGTGRTKPSASSRDLAGAGTPQAAGPATPGDEPAETQQPPEPAIEATEAAGEGDTAEPVGGPDTSLDLAVRPDAGGEDADVAGSASRHEIGAAGEADAGARTAPAASEPVRTAPRGIPVAEILAALRAGAQEVFGETWERDLAELLAFLRRRVTGDYAVDEYGLDVEVADRFLTASIRPLAERWFRVDVRGVENLPAEGGALVVSNHSGTLPLDGLVTTYVVRKHTGRHLRSLGADLVFRLPYVGAAARKAGATLACTEDAQRMLSHGELVGVWPEGFKGIGKPYSDRYKLQRFGRGGFVASAVATGVPIVPCSVVGAEEIYPMIGNVPALARLLGLPYVPITPFFPLLGPLGLIPLPSKWVIEFGEPIRTDSYDPQAADDPMLVFNITDQVRESIQQNLYTLLMQRRSVFG